MNKKEYLENLQQELKDYPEGFRREILDAFEEHFQEGETRQQGEEQIIAELGDLKELLSELHQAAQDAQVTAGHTAHADVLEKCEDSPKAQDDMAERNGDTLIAKDDTLKEYRDDTKEGNSIHAPLLTEEEPEFAGSDSLPKKTKAEASEWSTTPEVINSETVNCLVMEGMDTSTDVHLSRGEELRYHFEPKSGITIGNGMFIRTKFFAPKKEAEVLFDITDPECRITVHGGGGDLYVQVPACVEEIRVQLSSGDLEMEEIATQRIVARSLSGDIAVRRCSADDMRLEAKSGDIDVFDTQSTTAELQGLSGDIKAVAMEGRAKMKTLSGDIKVKEHISGEVCASTKSGDIQINSNSPFQANATSGDIEIDCRDSVGTIEASATSGDIRCRIEGTDYTAVMTTISGSLRNQSSLFGTKSGRKMVIGSGKSQVTLKSVSGDIILL